MKLFARENLRGLAFQLGFTLFSAWLTWPIYGDAYLAIVLSVAFGLGVVGASLLRSRNAGWLANSLFGLIGVVVIGPIVSSPSVFTSGSALISNWIDAVSSIVYGWKQLVTIDPPVGTYHGLMTPAFVVFFVSNLLAGLAVFGNQKRRWAAIIPFFAMVIFAFAFGQSAVNETTSVFGFVIDVPSSWVSGLVILMASIKYLTPRVGKRPKFDFASVRNGKALTRQLVQSGGSWSLVIAALVVVSLIIGVSSVGNREVLRSAPPAQFKGQELSPLSLYRQNFTDNQKLNQTILKFSSSNSNLDRIRVAVMSHFDGQVFKVENDQGQPLEFQLLPAALNSSVEGAKTATTKFELTARNSAWLPLVSNVSKVDFTGSNAQSFGDHFYFNRPTDSGALLGQGTPAGVVNYSVYSFVDDTQIDPTTITATPNTICADAANPDSVVPQSLCDWIALQDEDLSNAAGFEKLIKTLRARGFLSHSLDKPTGTNNWATLLPSGYVFETSKAGHSTGRIDQMFKDLNALQESFKPGTPNSRLVATAGDDEQFASAAALLARAAGFDSRVVLGFKTQNEGPSQGVSACANQTCMGKNLTAWVEISNDGSTWLPIDATPQFKDRLRTPVQPNGLKQHQQNPGQDNANVLPPAQVDPSNSSDCKKDCGPKFDWIGLILTILGYVALGALAVTVVFGPPFAIILGKRRRRRNREKANTLAKRITGAWDEYVDNLVDLGERGLRRLPANETRPELLAKAAKANAELASSAYAQAMVRFTDFAAFAPEEPNPDYEREVWNFVDTEFAKSKAELSRYRRLRVLLSLRSIIYRASAPEANTVNHRRIGADGSTFGAFLAVAKLGAAEGLEWFKPRAKKFIDSRLPFLNKLASKIAPNLQKLLRDRKGKNDRQDV